MTLDKLEPAVHVVCEGCCVNALTVSLCAGKPAKSPGDTPEMAQSIYNCYLLIKRILSDPSAVKMMNEGEEKDPQHAAFQQVMTAAQATYVACFHAFYPTSALKWLELCSMLSMVEPVSGEGGRGGKGYIGWEEGLFDWSTYMLCGGTGELGKEVEGRGGLLDWRVWWSQEQGISLCSKLTLVCTCLRENCSVLLVLSDVLVCPLSLIALSTFQPSVLRSYLHSWPTWPLPSPPPAAGRGVRLCCSAAAVLCVGDPHPPLHGLHWVGLLLRCQSQIRSVGPSAVGDHSLMCVLLQCAS